MLNRIYRLTALMRNAIFVILSHNIDELACLTSAISVLDVHACFSTRSNNAACSDDCWKFIVSFRLPACSTVMTKDAFAPVQQQRLQGNSC